MAHGQYLLACPVAQHVGLQTRTCPIGMRSDETLAYSDRLVGVWAAAQDQACHATLSSASSLDRPPRCYTGTT
jgi:hypothetical protein